MNLSAISVDACRLRWLPCAEPNVLKWCKSNGTRVALCCVSVCADSIQCNSGTRESEQAKQKVEKTVGKT